MGYNQDGAGVASWAVCLVKRPTMGGYHNQSGSQCTASKFSAYQMDASVLSSLLTIMKKWARPTRTKVIGDSERELSVSKPTCTLLHLPDNCQLVAHCGIMRHDPR